MTAHTILLAAIWRTHHDHARRKAQTAQWQRNRARAEMVRKAA